MYHLLVKENKFSPLSISMSRKLRTYHLFRKQMIDFAVEYFKTSSHIGVYCGEQRYFYRTFFVQFLVVSLVTGSPISNCK